MASGKYFNKGVKALDNSSVVLCCMIPIIHDFTICFV